MKHKLIHDPVFRSETLFYIADNFEQVRKHLKSKHDTSISEEFKFDGHNGCCIECEDNKTHIFYWVIWIRNHDLKNAWKVMVHEANHLTFRILDHRGVKYSSDNDETFCYLHEFFIGKFWHEMCK